MTKLHNNHNVYILGAGFSVDAGLPTIQNFMFAMRDAHDWLLSQNRSTEASAIAAVLDFRLNAASAAYRVKLDLENIEELFSLASASSRALTQKIQTAIAATLDYKESTSKKPNIRFELRNPNCEFPRSWKSDKSNDTNWFECPAYEFYLKALIGNWTNNDAVSSNSIITFNYDLLVEEALKNLSVDYTYKLDKNNTENPNAIELLKLHGSINWGLNKGASSYSLSNSYEELREKNQIPQLVPPTWRKIFTGQLRQIWDSSLVSLEKATRVFVIGFSIPPTDNHFKYLMAAGLKNNISLREIVFVNPDKLVLEHRAKSLFGDVSIVGQANSNSNVKIIGCNLSSFLHEGLGNISSYGRPLPNNINHISLF